MSPWGTRAAASPPSTRRSSLRTAASERSAEKRCSPAGAPYARPRVARASSPAMSRCASSRRFLAFGVVAGAFEMTPCLDQEDVVERWLVDLQVRDAHVGAVECANDLGEVAVVGGKLHRDALRTKACRRCPEALEHRGERALLLRVCGNSLERRAGDLRLQLIWRPFGNDVAVVDDPDAIGEHV